MATDTAERPREIALTEEGGGTVATCKACGWLNWWEDRGQALSAGRDHKCRKEDLKPPGRRYPPKKKRGS